MIQRAKLSQIEEILAITKACGNKMNDDGIFQWNQGYPNLEVLRNDISSGELYIYILEKNIVGCIVISTKMDEEYQDISWDTPTSNHYYIHRLAVHPNCQGKGIARNLMDFAEHLALENNKVSIRLDTFSQNSRNQRFYETRGYKRLGSIFFPNQSDFPFYCYELSLPLRPC